MKPTTVAAALVIAALTWGCDQKPKTELAPTPNIQPAQPAVPANVNPPAAKLDHVPVSEDFEEQATLEITADNLDSELDKLEREVTE